MDHNTFNQKKKKNTPLGVVAHAYNSSTWEVEMGGFQVLGQPELHSKILSQNLINNK
jgi:hypothetical protein